MDTISIGKFVKDAYTTYGREVAINRQLPNILDGLKPVMCRLIYSSLEYKDFIKTATLIGTTIGKYHPHGIDSMNNVVARLVNLGIFEGQGNFGYKFLTGDSCEPAASRYTEVKLNDRLRSQLSRIIMNTPTKYSEIGYPMVEYIPTPIPYALVTGDLGIGIGISQKIPAFRAKSLITAYLKDNPEYLESSYGYEILPDSELKKLWEEGSGSITYSMKCSLDHQYVVLEGDPTIFTPNLSVVFNWISKGLVNYEDRSTNTGKLVFYKAKNKRVISTTDIYNEVVKNCKDREVFWIRVHDSESAFQIPIRKWIHYTYKNYESLVLKSTKTKIAKLSNDITYYKVFNEVFKDYLAGMSINDLSSKYNVEIGIINRVISKSAEYARNLDVNVKIKGIETEIQSLKSEKAKDWINNYVEVLK